MPVAISHEVSSAVQPRSRMRPSRLPPPQPLGSLPYTTDDLLDFMAGHHSDRLARERQRGVRILLQVGRGVRDWRDLPGLALVTRDNRSLPVSRRKFAYKAVRELGRFLLARNETIVPLGTGDLRYARREYFELEVAFQKWCEQHGYAWKRSICQPFLQTISCPLAEITYEMIRASYRATRSSTRRRQLSLRPFCRFVEERGLIRVRGAAYDRIGRLPVGLRVPILRYLEHVIRPRFSQSYRMANEGTLAGLGAFLQTRGITTMSALDVASLEDHVATLRRRGLKKTTINNHINLIETFCVTLIEWGILARQPVRRSLYFEEPRWLPRPLDETTSTNVLDALRARPRPAAAAVAAAGIVALECGLRIGELVHLRRADIDYVATTIRIELGKFSKDRVVPMSPEAASTLMRWGDEHPPQAGCDFVFQHNGRSYSTVAFQAEVIAVARARGIRVTFHQFRHTFATRYLERGGRIEVLQQILGHDNINATMRYARVAPVTVRQDYLRAMHRTPELSEATAASQPRSVLDLLREEKS